MLLLATDILGRDDAREAARRELSRPAYDEARPPLVYRVLQWVIDKLQTLLGEAAATVPGGTPGLVLLLLLLGLLVFLIVLKVRPSAARAGRPAELFGGGQVLTAEHHRRLADTAAADGRWADAVRERLRAIARELEQRGVLDARPGRTADELAREAGGAVPEVRAPLLKAATVFDEVWYGGRPADASSYAVMVEVDRVVGAARLVRA
jgi:hypothetical protein